MPWMPGIPQDPTPPKGALDPIAVVLHRTYGAWGGDYSVGKQGIFQFLIGKDAGNWVQFMSSDSVAWHCNGANFKAVGIEIEGTNEDVLTAWQSARLGDILAWLHATHGIPLDYLDPNSVAPASVHVNDGNFRGVISHVSVMTDDGSQQHTDEISVAAFNLATKPQPAPVPDEEDDDMIPLVRYAGDANKTTYRVEHIDGLLYRVACSKEEVAVLIKAGSVKFKDGYPLVAELDANEFSALHDLPAPPR